MTTLQDLLKQKADIEKAIEKAMDEDRTSSILKIKALMDELKISIADLQSAFNGKAKREPNRKKVSAKYQNTETGETWSGRGLQPKWIKTALVSGRRIEDFAVNVE